MPISEETFLMGLKAGVENTRNLMNRATEFHGSAVQTEYLLTSDIAREFIERGLDVRVECLNRELVNGITARKGTSKARRKKLGTKRTDVALVSAYLPLAMVEVKIGIRKLTGVSKDLNKIITSMRLMDAKYGAMVIGASVFQVHLATTNYRHAKEHFVSAIRKVERRFQKDLKTYARTRPDFRFIMHPLQAPHEGIVEQEIERDVNGALMLGRPGHATLYYTILVRSKRPLPPTPLEEQVRQAASKDHLERQ
jgi:hypothetical protein